MIIDHEVSKRLEESLRIQEEAFKNYILVGKDTEAQRHETFRRALYGDTWSSLKEDIINYFKGE